MGGPNQSEDAGCDAGHTKAKESAGGNEFMRTLPVELEDSHMGCSSACEKEEEDSGDRIVNGC